MIVLVVWCIIIGVLGFYSLYRHIQKKSYREGWDRGRKDLIYRLNDAHYWFTNKEKYPHVFNTIHLISRNLLKYDNFNISNIRDIVDTLNNVRYCDLSKEDYCNTTLWFPDDAGNEWIATENQYFSPN